MCPFGGRELAVGAFAEVFKDLIQGVQGSVLEIASASRRRCPTWLTSGAGSVILLNGQPGDPVVSLHPLKQPAAEVGPRGTRHERHRQSEASRQGESPGGASTNSSGPGC